MCSMGEGLVGSAALDVTDVIRAGTKTRLAFPLSNKAGTLNLEVRVPHMIPQVILEADGMRLPYGPFHASC